MVSTGLDSLMKRIGTDDMFDVPETPISKPVPVPKKESVVVDAGLTQVSMFDVPVPEPSEPIVEKVVVPEIKIEKQDKTVYFLQCKVCTEVVGISVGHSPAGEPMECPDCRRLVMAPGESNTLATIEVKPSRLLVRDELLFKNKVKSLKAKGSVKVVVA